VVKWNVAALKHILFAMVQLFGAMPRVFTRGGKLKNLRGFSLPDVVKNVTEILHVLVENFAEMLYWRGKM
jgi:hypothetical protein